MIFDKYAQHYDIFYGKKNYRAECQFLESIFKKYIRRTPKMILDLGCGTGGHAIPLALRGYKVTGVDASRSMLKLAAAKCRLKKVSMTFHNSKLQDLKLNKKFDVVVSMFSVIDYILKDKDLRHVFANVLRQMRNNSLFIFDFWNKEAVERYYSASRKKTYTLGGKAVERKSITKIFPSHHLCEVNYFCHLRQKGRLVDTFKEKHTIRYFSIDEIAKFLTDAGFVILGVHPFLNLKGVVRKNTWDVTVVAKRA